MFFAVVAIVALTAVSCQKDDADTTETPNTSTTGTILYVDYLSTRVSFEEQTDKTINLDWELDDIFTVYDASGNRVDNFICTSVESGTFESVSSITLTNDASYTAVYPASDEATLAEAQAAIEASMSVQSGESINNLDDSCYMLDTFTYNSEDPETIEFEHQMAIMSVIFSVVIDGETHNPSKLVFENGEEIYTVNSDSGFTSDGVYYTAHIMVNPYAATTRTIAISLYDADKPNIPYIIYSRSTTATYAAGVRYTASTYNSELYKVVEYDVDDVIGSGTVDDPYQFSTAYDLETFSQLVTLGVTCNDIYFELTDNIDLDGSASNPWSPVGTPNNKFAGYFDGGGYEISGIYIDSKSSKQGLFAYVDEGGVVCNLGVSGTITSDYGSTGSATYETGSIAAYNHGTIINCYSKVDIKGNVNVGGIVGLNDAGGIVANCYNHGSVTAVSSSVDGKNVGGLIGQNAYGGTLYGSYNAGEVTGTSLVGGVVGYNVISDGTPATVSGCNYYLYDNSLYVFGNATNHSSLGTNYTMCGLADANMIGENTLFTNLNTNAASYNTNYKDSPVQACAWEAVTNGYPILDFYNIASGTTTE